MSAAVRMLFAIAALLAMAGLSASTGCRWMAASKSWTCTFGTENGVARLDLDGVTLIFEGVRVSVPSGQVGGGTSFSVRLSGPGTGMTTTTWLGTTVETSYRDDVNTITIGRYVARLLEEGMKIEVGGKTFDLSAGRKTIVIIEDGTAAER